MQNTSENEQLPGDTTLPSSEKELTKLIKNENGNFKYSVEDFFRNPDKLAYQLSPNGKYFSYMGPYERRRNIFVRKVGEERALRLTSEKERDIAGYFWANNNRIVFIKDSGGDENFKLFAVNKDGSNPKELTPFEGVRIQIIDELEDVEDELIIGMNKDNAMLFEPYRINIDTGVYEKLASNEDMAEPILGWMTDHEGKLRIAVQMIGGVNHRLLYREKENEAFKAVITTDFRETLSPLFFDFENDNVVYTASNLGRDKTAIVKFDLNTAKEIGDPLFEHKEVDVSNLAYSRKRKVLTGVSYTTWKRQITFFDKETEEIFKRLEKALGSYEIVITSTSKAEDKFMVRTYSDRSLGAYYFYDKTTDTLEKIAEVSPWIEEGDMAEMKAMEYKSRDGLTIQAYLTFPKGKKLAALPLIVNPHGGPWVRDNWGFNPEVQYLASRGFAVLQMNYRGSTGYGRSFWEKSFKQWGKKMQDDVTDGVNWLIEGGIVDPKRVAIYGASYGGYATLAGICFTPDLYACAIDYVGVSNLFTFMETIPPYWVPYLEMLQEMVGHPEKDKALMESASPAFHIDRIKTPLFVIQGANDPRVNIDESDQIVQSLRAKGIDVPYMVKYNEGHGFSNEENKFEFYKAMIGFLQKHLGE